MPLSPLLTKSYIVRFLLLLTGVPFATYESALARPYWAEMASSFALEFYDHSFTSSTPASLVLPGFKDKVRMTVGPV